MIPIQTRKGNDLPMGKGCESKGWLEIKNQLLLIHTVELATRGLCPSTKIKTTNGGFAPSYGLATPEQGDPSWRHFIYMTMRIVIYVGNVILYAAIKLREVCSLHLIQYGVLILECWFVCGWFFSFESEKNRRERLKW